MVFLESLTGIMSFTSVTYLAFLVLAVLVYFVLPGAKARSAWLLLASSFFYLLFSPKWFPIIIAVTALTYCVGLALGKARTIKDERHQLALRRIILWTGIVLGASALIIFKYTGFAAQLTNRLLSGGGVGFAFPVLKLIMPIGISFWTFQTIAYMVDVYKGKTEPEKNILFFATSVMFFPIVTMGPITKIQELVPQLSVKHKFDYNRMQSGLLLIGWGFFKKLMIADRLAVFVNTVFSAPRNYSGTVNGLIFFVAAVFFAIQLYTDFSGYTDIVRGTARLFGVNLPLNFAAPYFARSVADFWRRWHMTLMDWLKNYIYIPLGGNRKGPIRKNFNLLATFFVSGLWHGAGLNYIVWGLLNGSYQVAGTMLKPVNDWCVKVFRVNRESFAHKLFQTTLTFVLITIAWVFFRANSLSDALYMLPRMFIPTIWIFTDDTMIQQGLNYSELMIAFASIGAVWIFDYFKTARGVGVLAKFNQQHLVFRWMCYYSLIFLVMVFGHYGGTYNAADFLYFKF